MKSKAYFWSYLSDFFLEREIFQKKKKVVEKIKTHILCSITFFPPKIVPFMRQCAEIWYSWTGHRWQYNTVQAGYLRLQTRTQNMHYFLLFHCNKWLHGRPSVLRYAYIGCPVFIHILLCKIDINRNMQPPIAGLLVNNELVRMRKEAVIIYAKLWIPFP